MTFPFPLMKLRVLFCAVAATFNFAAQAAQAAPAAAPAPVPFDRAAYAIAHQTFVLPNGLTLIVHEDHAVPIVGVNLWYHVGSRNEKRGKTGFAHLFEHFFFNGSENYPHGFREAMDDLGANNRNGTTNTDRTNFFEDVPTAALERTLYLESDRMGYLANYISQQMLERERGVVQNEKRQGENQPYGRVRNEMGAKMYPYSHPYSWSTIGSMDDLNAASLDDIKDWYRTYYGPNNAVISLAGDITPARALELVTKYFGEIPPGPPLPRLESWIPKLERNIRDEMADQVPQVRITRSYFAPHWRDPQVQQLELFAGVLAGSKSARLDRRLVYDKAMATSVSASVNDGELAGTFTITVMVKQGVDPLAVEREVDTVLAELLDKGPTAAELARVKTVNLADFSRSIERLGGFGGRSDVLAESMTYGGAPDAYLNRLEQQAVSTNAQVKTVANQWLRAPFYTMTVRPFPKLAAGKAIDRKLLPALGETPDIAFPPIARATLKNGVKVLLVERHGAPIVHVALAVNAGAADDSAGKLGAASLALDLIDKGSTTRSAFQMAEAFESLGARFSAIASLENSLVRLQTTSANLTPSLALMADAALHPAFAQDQFALAQQRRLALLGQERAQPTALAVRLMPGLLYGPANAYGKPILGDDASVKALTRADLAAWHGAWFVPANATIVVTGDTTLAKALPALEASFGGWRGGAAPVRAAASAGRSAPARIYLVDKPDAPQSIIAAGQLSPAYGQPEDLAMEPVMSNFGGMATSRLNRNLRLDKHWSYGTSGRLTDVRGERALQVIAPVQTDKTREAMIEVAREIRGVAGERPLVGEEYDSIMRSTRSRLAGRFETVDALESAVLQSVNHGLSDDYWQTYPTRLRALTAPQLAAASGKFVKPEQITWLIIGDLRKIEAGVRALNWGDVVVLDGEGKTVR